MTLQTALKGWLPESVGFALRDPTLNYPLMGDEAAAIARAVPKRKAEFSAGRDAARGALVQLGLAESEIPVGKQRAPVWPKGICGSITHSDAICIALAARQRDILSIGIDVEPDVPLDDGLRRAILHQSELDCDAGRAIQIFSLKEALFKALFPITGELMGFQDARSTEDGKVALTRRVGTYPVDTAFEVRLLRARAHVISLCLIEGNG